MSHSFLGRRAFFGAPVLLLHSNAAAAPESTIARFTLHVVSSGWVLDVDAPRSAVRAALKKKHGDIADASTQELRRLLSDYLRANVRLYFDGLPVRLTTIDFLHEDEELQMRCPIRVPKTAPQKIRAELLAFNEVGHQQNLFRVEVPGGEGQAVASNQTGFVAEWVRGEEQFETPDLQVEPDLEERDALAAPPQDASATPPASPGWRLTSTVGIVAALGIGAVGVALVFRGRGPTSPPEGKPPQPGG